MIKFLFNESIVLLNNITLLKGMNRFAYKNRNKSSVSFFIPALKFETIPKIKKIYRRIRIQDVF